MIDLGTLALQQDTAQQLTNFFDVSNDLLCIRDASGRFVRVNRAWETVLGYTMAELEGAPLLPLIHPDDVAATRGHMQRIHSEEEVIGFINRYRGKDGEYRHLEWKARRSGDIVYGVARDVSKRLAAEAEIRAARQAAEDASRAKSEFLANMSHEIRTPLNGVIGVIDALGQTELTPAQREMVELVRSSGVTLERLVSDILDVSKIEAGRLDIEARAFDLRAELDAVLDLNRMRALEKGLTFDVAMTKGACGWFRGDGVRIRQVLGNLLSNAVKFTAEGEVSVRLDVTGSRLAFEVADTGVGFDQAFADGLFQRFSQADATITRRFGGTGLGLSICKSLVEMMGGEIVASSEPGHGSRFRVTLPLEPCPPPGEAGAAPHPGLAETPDALRILLAEDHPINQKVIQLILQPHGARITTVGDGAAAVEAFAAGAFDVVLMDMQMPVMDGLTAIRAIRRHEALTPGRRRTPIAMLTANAMTQHRTDAAEAGADLHIAKPVTAASLLEGIGRALEPAGPSPG